MAKTDQRATTVVDQAKDSEAPAPISAPEVTPPAVVAAPPGKTPAEEIAELKAMVAKLADLVGPKPSDAQVVSAQAVQDIIQPIHEITVGGTNRPEKGPLHLSHGVPIFNPNRPTGRAG